MADYTMTKDRNYTAGNRHEVRDSQTGKLVHYATDLADARRAIERRDGGSVDEEK